MEPWDRRRWLKVSGLSLGTLLAPFGYAGLVAAPQSGSRPQRTASELAALAWIRFMNTSEAYYRYRHGGFGKTEELTPEALSDLKAKVPPLLDDSLESLLTVEKDRYVVVVREIGSGHAFWSNQDGVIFEGQLPRISIPRDQPTAWGTYGAPIVPPPPTPSSRARSFLVAIGGFFMPTLEASRGKCGCGGCKGPGNCTPDCGGIPCCNLGYADCTWCCPGDCCVY
jgi:hypothetical protein